MKIDGGEMVVRMLKKEGVSHLFSLSGGHINPIYNACLDHKIRIIDTRHEQGAAMMADGWARLTRSPGVCVLTAGPGHTNALTGIKTAECAQSPVLAISGHSELNKLEMGALQEMDQMRAAETMTKKAWFVAETKRIPEYISLAFRYALSSPYGPVNVNIPIDLMLQRVEEGEVNFPSDYRSSSLAFGDPRLIAQALDLLQKAERPAVIVGNAAWFTDAREELVRLAEATHLPIFTIDMARGLISDSHPDCYGEAYPRLNGAAQLLNKCDVVLLVNVKLNYARQYGAMFGPETSLIQVEDNPVAIGHNRGVHLGIFGSAKAVIGQLADQAGKGGRFKTQGWGKMLREGQQAQMRAWEEGLKSKEKPIHPLRLAREIADFVGKEDLVTLDGADIKNWAKAIVPATVPGQFIEFGPFGTLGTGTPHAIAAKVAFPKKRVISICGDGAFGLTAMEFDTAVRHHLPFVSIIGNNQGWGMILHHQRELYGKDRVIGSQLGVVRYDRIVEAMGGYGELVEDPGEIKPALERAFASGKPACLNVLIQGSASPVTEASLLARRSQAFPSGDTSKT
jgi:acetolactate synthase I/II/III large subunit